MSKLASLTLIVAGSLLFVQAAAAQGDPGYSSGSQPVYAAPGGATVGTGANNGGGIKDNGPHRRPMAASVMLSTPWRYGFGVGLTGAFEIPIVHDGFIPSINNSFSIEPFFTVAWNNYNAWGGFGLYDDDVDAWEFTPGVAALWSFYFTPRLRAYAAARIGVTVLHPTYDGDRNLKFKNSIDGFGELAPGIFWNITDSIALRADIGWWSGIKGGVAFLL